MHCTCNFRKLSCLLSPSSTTSSPLARPLTLLRHLRHHLNIDRASLLRPRYTSASTRTFHIIIHYGAIKPDASSCPEYGRHGRRACTGKHFQVFLVMLHIVEQHLHRSVITPFGGMRFNARLGRSGRHVTLIRTSTLGQKRHEEPATLSLSLYQAPRYVSCMLPHLHGSRLESDTKLHYTTTNPDELEGNSY